MDLGVPMLFLAMFLRKKKNTSGSTSVQIVSKARGKYRVLKTVGSSKDSTRIEELCTLAEQEMAGLTGQSELFMTDTDKSVELLIGQIENSHIRTVGPNLIFGKIFDHIGFGEIPDEMFKHLTVARLAFPLSKLKTVEYLYRYQGIQIGVDAIYRFLDRLNESHKDAVEQIAFAHTKKALGGEINVVFYDMTTIYFEASDEDDLRRTGFSKDGKHHKPQIFLGLLVGLEGHAIGYDIFQGNIHEGHTLIPFLKRISEKFELAKPIVIADAGLLSKTNIASLSAEGYKYILGGRIKNETENIKKKITSGKWKEGRHREFEREDGTRLVITFSEKRAKKDAAVRKKGFERLQSRVASGKMTKSSINNRGYNKYLRLEGEMKVTVDKEKFDSDTVWDGLKGYVTNAPLSSEEVVDNYRNLWRIERAFRMSKTDLRIRPIYHRLRRRIEAHICISFTAYCIYRALERALKREGSEISVKRASELTHSIYSMDYTLPDSGRRASKLLKMNPDQEEIYRIVQKYF